MQVSCRLSDSRQTLRLIHNCTKVQLLTKCAKRTLRRALPPRDVRCRRSRVQAALNKVSLCPTRRCYPQVLHWSL